MHYLYRITNTLNNKIYIGQTVDDKRRWGAHKSYAKNSEKTGQYIHRAMAKYGTDNFIFEVIAICKTQEDADETEMVLIEQYDSRNKENGYNLAPGGGGVGSGVNHPLYGVKQSQDTINRRVKKLTGQKRTDEQRANISAALLALDKEAIYTEEVRQRMSEAHLGNTDTEETKQKKSESAAIAWSERISYDEIRCAVPECLVEGKHHYIFLDNVRYCRTHGQRLRRTGSLELVPHTSHNKGGTSHNRTKFTREQVTTILSSTDTTEKLSRDFGVTAKVIKRVRLQGK